MGVSGFLAPPAYVGVYPRTDLQKLANSTAASVFSNGTNGVGTWIRWKNGDSSTSSGGIKPS